MLKITKKRSKKAPKKGLFRLFSVCLGYLITALLFGVVILSALPMVNQDYAELQATLTGYVNSLLTLIQSNEFIYDIIVSIVGVSGQNAQEFINNLLLQYSGYLSSFAGNLLSIVTGIITSTSDIIVALILSFYFLLSRDMIAGIIRKISTAYLPKKFRFWSARFFRRFYINVIEFFSSRLLCSFILGVLCYLLTWALNIPFYPLLSLIVFFLNIIPFFGPIIAALLCTVIIFIVKPEMTWVFVLIIVLINLTEHFLIERSLLSKRLRPNVGVTMVSVLLFSYYFGFLGAIFAVPVWVTVATECRGFLNRRLRQKGITHENETEKEAVHTEEGNNSETTEEKEK